MPLLSYINELRFKKKKNAFVCKKKKGAQQCQIVSFLFGLLHDCIIHTAPRLLLYFLLFAFSKFVKHTLLMVNIFNFILVLNIQLI